MKRAPVRVFKNGSHILAFVPAALFLLGGVSALKRIEDEYGKDVLVHPCPKNQAVALEVVAKESPDKEEALRFWDIVREAMLSNFTGLVVIH